MKLKHKREEIWNGGLTTRKNATPCQDIGTWLTIKFALVKLSQSLRFWAL